MKGNHLFVLWVVFILFSACIDREKKVITNLIVANECELTGENREIVKQIKESLFKKKDVVARSRVEVPNHWLTREEVAELTLVMQPYYELDTSFFSTDLDEEKIEDYVKMAQDKRLFFGKRGEKYMLMVIAERSGGEWNPKLRIEDSKDCFKELFNWLLPVLEASPKKNFYVLNAMQRDYFVYHDSEGKLVFRNMSGNIKMNSREFTFSTLHMYNNMKEAREYMDKNKGF